MVEKFLLMLIVSSLNQSDALANNLTFIDSLQILTAAN